METGRLDIIGVYATGPSKIPSRKDFDQIFVSCFFGEIRGIFSFWTRGRSGSVFDQELGERAVPLVCSVVQWCPPTSAGEIDIGTFEDELSSDRLVLVC